MKPFTEKPGKCPPGPLAKCVVPLPIGNCKSDRDCGGNQKCCRDMCTPTCMKPFTEKPGKCPPPNPLVKCTFPPPYKACYSDSDCGGNQKCCNNPCNPTCTKPFTGMKPGTCPVPRTMCLRRPEPVECKVDGDCDGIKKCCVKECELRCINPKDKKIADKSWKCPVVYTFARCDSYKRDCFHDYECSGNEKCCDGGCIFQCTPRP
ncbi:perlwapin-like isoform X2 [Bufo bufo]|uniref:perlwapin-like isoform X2 n=1 Tax=Bufo bufo TaxID=8384 RepID=UPI001ABE41E6|nr:perlwapin-like isoform X2 [Bufo bufo]